MYDQVVVIHIQKLYCLVESKLLIPAYVFSSLSMELVIPSPKNPPLILIRKNLVRASGSSFCV